MKRCPTCEETFEGNKSFCPKDGSTLTDEMSAIPSEHSSDDDGEFETVVRTAPVRYEVPIFPEERREQEHTPAAATPPPERPKSGRVSGLVKRVLDTYS